MPDPSPFPHLRLSTALQDKARPKKISTENYDPYPTTTKNLGDRAAHSEQLTHSADRVVRIFQERQAQRGQPPDDTGAAAVEGVAPAGIPLLLEVENSADLDWLRTVFGFHVVSEEEEGFVIVAAQDIDLARFRQRVTAFGQGERRNDGVAKLYGIVEDDASRRERILSDTLLNRWPIMEDEGTYTVDVGVSCGGDVVLPNPVSRDKNDTDEQFAERQERWRRRRDDALVRLDEARMNRERDFEAFLKPYGPTYLDSYIDGSPSDINHSQIALPPSDGSVRGHDAAEHPLFSDSFTARIAISGRGLRDLVLNFPYVFEVAEVEDVDHRVPPSSSSFPSDLCDVKPLAPAADAPAVCVIDSGIQERHRLIAPAIDDAWSRCYVPEKSDQDVSDYVKNGGHGTRVAGSILYSEGIPTTGQYQLPFWIQNARVLDDSNRMDPRLKPWEVLPRIVERFQSSPKHTRLYNQSITGRFPHRVRHMSAWAATMDALSFERDVLFIQAAGNLETTSDHPFLLGIREHLEKGLTYPDYLRESLSRIPNPAQSMQALTVGSVIRQSFDDGTFASLGKSDQPASYSRAGLGIWGCVKPDVVEYGGDYARDAGDPPNIVPHEKLSQQMVRATLGSPGSPDRSSDAVGTSFAAPRVTHIAATLEEMLPAEPTLLYRALIAQSARWPNWAEREKDKQARCRVLQHIGYGIPDKGRATTNDEYRITLVTEGEQRVHIGEAHVYEVPIPDFLRDPGEAHDIRVEITLSYAASPRRTRRNMRGYLAAHVEWETIKLDETLDAFKARVFNTPTKHEASRNGLDWFLHKETDWGQIHGTSRNQATLQKDWTITKSSKLPKTFAMAIIGRRGWSNDPETFARYALAITFEAPNRDVKVYEPVRSLVINNVEITGQMELPFEVQT
jgi:hypothetical protein